MATNTHSDDSVEKPPITERFWRQGFGRGKLELLTGLLGHKMLKRQVLMRQRNQEAENRAARQAAFGNDGRWIDDDGDDMGSEQTVLGDLVTHVTNPTKASSGLGKLLLAGILGAAVPGAGIAGHFLALTNKASPVVEKVGLGKITDFNLQP